MQQNQQQHNVLSRSVFTRVSMFCRRWTNSLFSPRYLASISHPCPPQGLLLVFQSCLRCIALTWRRIRLLPAPVRCFPDFPSSSSVLLLAGRPAWTRFQVQGPLPGPWHGRPGHPEQRDALSVASMGAGLRAGGLEASGGASVLWEGCAGARRLHRRLHLHPDPHPHRSGAERTRRPGAQGDWAHL